MPKYLLMTAAALILAACGSPEPADEPTEDVSNESSDAGNEGGADDNTVETGDDSTPTEAASDDFVAACLNGTNLNEAMCGCVAGKAEEELTPGAREFLMASLNEDSEAVMDMRGRLSVQDMAVAGTFMVSASTECSREGNQ